MNARDTINPTITITDTYDNMLAILEEIEHSVLERTKDNGRTNIAKSICVETSDNPKQEHTSSIIRIIKEREKKKL